MDGLKHEIALRFDTNVAIQDAGDGDYVLVWDDFVVNAWRETFPSLSLTLMRLAVLVACGESDWEDGFADDPEAFVAKARAFLASATASMSGSTDPDHEPEMACDRCGVDTQNGMGVYTTDDPAAERVCAECWDEIREVV